MPSFRFNALGPPFDLVRTDQEIAEVGAGALVMEQFLVGGIPVQVYSAYAGGYVDLDAVFIIVEDDDALPGADSVVWETGDI